MALRTKFIQRVITARNTPVDNEVVYEAPVDLDHVVAEINEHIETEESVHSTVEKLENLKASMERFAEGGELPESAKFFAGIVYKDALKSGGLVVDEVSLESYAEDISLESVVDTIKRVWQTIFKFLAGLFEKVVGFFTKAETQAEAAIGEAEETIRVAKKYGNSVMITDETILKQLAKLAIIPSSGYWSVPGEADQQPPVSIDDIKDTVEAMDYIVFKFVNQAASAIDELVSRPVNMNTLRAAGYAIVAIADDFTGDPIKLDDGDLYTTYVPSVGGHGLGVYVERSGRSKTLAEGKPVVKLTYIPTEIKVTEVNSDDLTKQLDQITHTLSASTKYRSKVSKNFANYATFLEKYDVDKLAAELNPNGPEEARNMAGYYRSNIVKLSNFISSPAVLSVYVDTIRATKTVSKILKNAVFVPKNN